MVTRAGRRAFLALALLAGLLAAATRTARIDPQRYLAHIQYLASPELKGRAAGSPELEQAARYIAQQFRSYGLRPAGGSFLQAFPLTTNVRMGADNRFEVRSNGNRRALIAGEDFIPVAFSATGQFSGGVVFAGYGITAPEYGYDDYAGIDAKDKFVLVLRHEPQEFDERSVFAGRNYTRHAQLASKAANARLHGARGILFISDLPRHGGDVLEPIGRTLGPPEERVASVQLKWSVAAEWASACGKDFQKILEAIDNDLKPRSFPFPDTLQVDVHVDLERELSTVHNVAAYLPGAGEEYLILGAHYDHIGLGEHFSANPSFVGQIHPGADDNASGTAGLLELARYYGQRRPGSARGLLFLAFAGEELGLLGSIHYLNHPYLPIDKAIAMLNMDMIGRVREGKVYIAGADSSPLFRPALQKALPLHSQLHPDYSDAVGYGASDHASFAARGVPVLFFFSGLHSDYHAPSDTWDKIETAGAAEVLELILDITSELLEAPLRNAPQNHSSPANGLPAHGRN